MNINDIAEKVEVPKVKDKLEAMFEMQRELITKYLPIEEKAGFLHIKGVPVDIDDPAGQDRMKETAWRIVEELGEAMNCLKNKPWKQSPLATDQLHFYEELADFLHFSLELFIEAGLDADKLFRLYFLKSQVNKFRQESNY